MTAAIVIAIAASGPDLARAATTGTSPIRLAQADSPRSGLGNILSEARIGVLAHDVGLFGTNKEDGADIEFSMLFVSPDVLKLILSPKPELGASINTDGDTSQVYGGLAWDWNFAGPFFVEGTWGLSLHDGKLSSDDPERKDLGCRVLSRESASLGLEFLERHRLMVTFAHISNGGLCGHNDGLDTLGVRYGFRF